jgi:hypothetical protein
LQVLSIKAAPGTELPTGKHQRPEAGGIHFKKKIAWDFIDVPDMYNTDHDDGRSFPFFPETFTL